VKGYARAANKKIKGGEKNPAQSKGQVTIGSGLNEHSPKMKISK